MNTKKPEVLSFDNGEWGASYTISQECKHLFCNRGRQGKHTHESGMCTEDCWCEAPLMPVLR